ncbi:hypothetical protein HHK36_007870 [Tetracentron sinense]|uniref:EF-hand domain-containing protein n=1 Tax=Tetracentron sinense TaxID=13715 RepID=A0A835DJD6_TETSI|nr:hypothetical protein HHK36_007870 [Tetracentron sinense]
MASPRRATRRDKVRSIFDRFDINGDGCLNRDEMGTLVAAVNPSVKFTADQISAILDEVFRSYSDFVANPSTGLSFNGLLRTYEDGAGDVDRDYFALFSSPAVDDLPSTSSSSVVAVADNPTVGRSSYHPRVSLSPIWARSPNHGIDYDDTWKLVEDLEIVIRRRIKASNNSHRSKDAVINDGLSDNGWSTDMSLEFDNKRLFWDENCNEFKVFLKELKEIRVAVDGMARREESFDGHMAIGRTLYDYRLYKEALSSFRRATELNPTDVRPHFRMGNSLCSLGMLKEAKESYLLALDSAEMDSNRWSGLLPQIHVNLGIVLEGEGMLLGACDHYREAAILCPTHYRALKLLGSALFGVGEYSAAEKALEEAVFLNPEYPDAHCDLGSVLHAMGEEVKAILEFQKVLDLKPDHLDALYNLGGLFRDVGRYRRAAEMYARVLAIRPSHWRAQVNRAVSLLGAGEAEAEEANIALREAFKTTNRVELYDAISHLKQFQKKTLAGRLSLLAKKKIHGAKSKNKMGFEEEVCVVTVEASKFKQASDKGTLRESLASALLIRGFQRITRLDHCDITLLKKEMAGSETHISYSGNEAQEKSIRKAGLEVILRKLLHFLNPEAFRGAVKALDERVLAVLDATGSGRVDLGMFFAVIAPICTGPPGNRKRAAFDALIWRSKKGVQGQIGKSDALIYLRYLRVIYFSSQGSSDIVEVFGGEEENTMVSFPEFLLMFDDQNFGFGILSTLVNLETGDRIRHGGYSCHACKYPIIGPRFKETTSRFNLCVTCYSECKVPSTLKQEEYRFKEYWSETEALKDKLRLFGRHYYSNKPSNDSRPTA